MFKKNLLISFYIIALVALVSCSDSEQEEKNLPANEQSSKEKNLPANEQSSKKECILINDEFINESIDFKEICLEKTINKWQEGESVFAFGVWGTVYSNVPWYKEKGFIRPSGQLIPFEKKYMLPYEISKLYLSTDLAKLISTFFCEVEYDRHTDQYYFVTFSNYIPYSEKHWYARNIRSITPRMHTYEGFDNETRGTYNNLKNSDTLIFTRKIKYNKYSGDKYYGWLIRPGYKTINDNTYNFGHLVIDRQTTEFDPKDGWKGTCSSRDNEQAMIFITEQMEKIISDRLNKDLKSYYEIEQSRKEKELKDSLPKVL